MKGWQEAQLRNPAARIFVCRNKVGPGGDTAMFSSAAKLVQFDVGTGLGVFAYAEDFDATLDVGFRLPHAPAIGGAWRTLGTGQPPLHPLLLPGSAEGRR